MKIFVACMIIAVVVAEPPVNNRYLPPQQGFSQPSQTYGAPGFGGQRQTDAILRSRPSSTYGAPSLNQRPSARRPTNQYIPPQSPSNQYLPPQRLSNQYAPSSNQFAPPTNQYVPPTNQYVPPTNQYVPPTNQYVPPTNQYVPPTNQFVPPTNQYVPPGNQRASNQYESQQAVSNQYLPPGQGSSFGRQNAPGSQYGAPALSGAPLAPSQQYGAPGFGGNQQSLGSPDGAFRNAESRQYLPPGGRGGYAGDESNNEPANYSFEYKVKDEPSGNDFGHRESRQGDRAEGLYYVLLPDGRKQTVEYEADQEGYRPRISYEDTGLGAGGYNSNAQNGYDNQGPY